MSITVQRGDVRPKERKAVFQQDFVVHLGLLTRVKDDDGHLPRSKEALLGRGPQAQLDNGLVHSDGLYGSQPGVVDKLGQRAALVDMKRRVDECRLRTGLVVHRVEVVKRSVKHDDQCGDCHCRAERKRVQKALDSRMGRRRNFGVALYI